MSEKKKHPKPKTLTKIDTVRCSECTNTEECKEHFKNNGIVEFTGRTENCILYASEAAFALAREQEAEDAKALDYEDEDLPDEEEDEEKARPFVNQIDESKIPV